MEPENAWALQQGKNFNRLEKRLREDFPQFQDDECVDLLKEVCDTDSFDSHSGSVEGTCCMEKRRRIIHDAAALADAWVSAEILRKIFRRGGIPVHFNKVIRFLD